MLKMLLVFLMVPSLLLAATYQAEVLVAWKWVEAPESAFWPDFGTHRIFAWADKTLQPGPDQIKDPNLFVAQITCDNSTLDKMKQEGYVILWQQRVGDTKPVAKETKTSLDSLKTALTAKGVPAASLSATALADTAKADVTGQDVSIQLRDVMAKFPEAVKPK